MPSNSSKKSGMDNFGADLPKIEEDSSSVEVEFSNSMKKKDKKENDKMAGKTAGDDGGNKRIRKKQLQTLVIALSWFFGLVRFPLSTRV